jgi:hypothetical protein
LHNRAQWPHSPQTTALNQSKQPQTQKPNFLHCAHNAKNHCAISKIPYPKPSGRQVSNIPINGDQSRSMAEQLRKQTIQQNQPKATPERDFSPLFNNGKNH